MQCRVPNCGGDLVWPPFSAPTSDGMPDERGRDKESPTGRRPEVPSTKHKPEANPSKSAPGKNTVELPPKLTRRTQSPQTRARVKARERSSTMADDLPPLDTKPAPIPDPSQKKQAEVGPARATVFNYKANTWCHQHHVAGHLDVSDECKRYDGPEFKLVDFWSYFDTSDFAHQLEQNPTSFDPGSRASTVDQAMQHIYYHSQYLRVYANHVKGRDTLMLQALQVVHHNISEEIAFTMRALFSMAAIADDRLFKAITTWLRHTRDAILDEAKYQMLALANSPNNELQPKAVNDMTPSAIGKWLASNPGVLTEPLGFTKWREINLTVQDELPKVLNVCMSIGQTGLEHYDTFPQVAASKALRAAMRLAATTRIIINNPQTWDDTTEPRPFQYIKFPDLQPIFENLKALCKEEFYEDVEMEGAS